MPDPVRTHVVTVAGVRTPVAERGPADATEAVVFVHGNPGAGEDWAGLQGRLPDGIRAIAPDMPGFGSADAPEDFDYTVDGYATHLAGLLDALGITRAHLVLHDFGGPWGLAWAARRPAQVGSLVLLNTGALVDYSWHRLARIWRTPVVGEILMALSFRPVLERALALENPRLPKADLVRVAGQLTSPGTKRAVLRLYRATDPAGMAADIEALRAVEAPVLVVWGTDDRYIPAVQAVRQRRTFPQAHVETLDGLGHWAFLEEPEQVASFVVPFLQEHATAG
ncbi:alpha/beta fold hydrolase [Patulibacter sp.]|uniref:alpha/beta fold hydrolase n=1 Tax=Patulibacter sp. TaxID=1912859 RepID=UPI0027267533|nr:alpha/beta hydrolase [Patulibacter sp.]MDO9407736.1 alpha/beta hydrolase [Patulibacter sp.]